MKNQTTSAETKIFAVVFEDSKFLCEGKVVTGFKNANQFVDEESANDALAEFNANNDVREKKSQGEVESFNINL